MALTAGMRSRCIQSAGEVARTLEFSPYLVHLADQIVLAMTDQGKLEYNSVHLRLEKDAKDWTRIMGGAEVSRRVLGLLIASAFCGSLNW
jgi:hypothetical protein